MTIEDDDLSSPYDTRAMIATSFLAQSHRDSQPLLTENVKQIVLGVANGLDSHLVLHELKALTRGALCLYLSPCISESFRRQFSRAFCRLILRAGSFLGSAQGEWETSLGQHTDPESIRRRLGCVTLITYDLIANIQRPVPLEAGYHHWLN